MQHFATTTPCHMHPTQLLHFVQVLVSSLGVVRTSDYPFIPQRLLSFLGWRSKIAAPWTHNIHALSAEGFDVAVNQSTEKKFRCGHKLLRSHELRLILYLCACC